MTVVKLTKELSVNILVKEFAGINSKGGKAVVETGVGENVEADADNDGRYGNKQF